PEKMKRWEQASYHTAISIPRPNPFLPAHLSIKKEQLHEKESLIPQPTLICNEPLGKIYWSEDTKFLVPEVCWILSLKTPLISDADPMTHVFADLYCHAVSEKLKTTSYEALMGGLSFSLKPTHGSLELKIKGYSDKAADFLQTVMLAMKTVNPTQEELLLYQGLLARDYTNTLTVSPLKQGSEVLLEILFKEFSGLQQKATALENVLYQPTLAFCKNVLQECYIEGVLYGNTSSEEAKNIWKMAKQILAAKPYPPSHHPKIELANLPSQDHPVYLTLKSQHPANALILTTDCGNFSFKRRAAQEILTKGLEEPFFSELRTRQQTAYLVSNWSQELERHLYSFFAIQSSSHDPRDLLARFELFIESSLQDLTDKVIPKERFESIRIAHIQQLEHPAKNLAKMGGLLHTIAFQYDGDFEWIEKRIQAFQELTYEEFIGYAQEFLGKDNLRRLAVCVNAELPQKGHFSYRHVTTPEKLRSEICYEGRETLSGTKGTL
ncbi:MAG TPA: insulinase family protein, partial [Waddliaceae bacterium]